MIQISHMTKKYPTRQGPRTVLDDVNLSIKAGEKVGILGRNGSGKSTLIRLISGAEQPTTGSIHRGISVSWPLAFGGAFQGTLTGLDNLRFICRIYGASIEDKIDYVQEFSELGNYLREPLKNYSAGMRARLAFAVSMAIEFDCYLIDEVLAVGDSRFHEKCQHELFEKRKDRSMLIVSHIPEQMRAHCDTFYVLNEGRMEKFEDIDRAYDYYTSSN